MTDILLAVALGFVQVFLTWFSVDYVLEQKRKKFAAVIGAASLLGLFLIGLSAYRAVKAQEELAKKVDKVSETQGQLDKKVGIIEHNTQQPANLTVNVPPQPGATPEARITLAKYESSYDTQMPNGQVINMMFVNGRPVSQNLYFRNDGTAIADDADGLAKVYIVPASTKETDIVVKFKSEFAKHKLLKGGVIQPGGADWFWFTALSDEIVSQDMQDKLAKDELRLYVLSKIVWRDPTGNHFIHLCRKLQAPEGTGGAIWQRCDDFTQHH